MPELTEFVMKTPWRAVSQGPGIITRFAVVVAVSLATGSALAQNMSPEAARRFVAGKLFAFRCVDGSGGSGRIYADGSVIGKIQSNGSERPVWLPPETLTVRGNLVCASLSSHIRDHGKFGSRCHHSHTTVKAEFACAMWNERNVPYSFV